MRPPGVHALAACMIPLCIPCSGAADEPPTKRQVAPGIMQVIHPSGPRELSVSGKVLRDTTPPPEPFPETLSQADLGRGYLVYHRPQPDAVFRQSAPQPQELVRELGTSVSRGERRHAQFAVYGLQDLGQVEVTATAFEGPDGNTLPDSAVVPRPVRVGPWRNYWDDTFRFAPKLIDAPDTVSQVGKGESQQFWVTVCPPPSAQPGEYTGKLLIRPGTGDASALDLTVRVLPFHLDDGRWWGVYYYSGYGPNTPRDFADMKAHGVNSMLFCPPAYADPLLVREEDRVKISFPVADKTMAELKRQGFRRPVAYFPRLLSCQVLRLFGRVDGDKFQAATYYGQPAVKYKAEDFPEDLKPVLMDVYRQMVHHAQQAQWPEILWYLVDEPQAEMETQWAKLEYGLFAQACPGQRTLCTAYTRQIAANIGTKLNVRVADLWRLETDAAHRTRHSDTQLWGIRWLSQYNTYSFPRQYAGLALDRIGLDGFTEWTYYGAPLYSPYAQVRNKEGCHYAYTDHQGRLLSTITWEAVQEGIDDARYVATLRRLIEEGQDSADPALRDLARRAQEGLQDVIDQVPAPPKALPRAKLDDLRATLSAHIVALLQAGATLDAAN